jgi:DNA replication protein DnaC
MKSLQEIIASGDYVAMKEWIAAHPTDAQPQEDTQADTRTVLKNIGVPPAFQDVEPSQNPPRVGRLYVGKPGVGKTWRATSDLLALALDGKRSWWLSVPAYLVSIRDHTQTFFVSDVRKLDAIVLDDIAQVKPADWQKEQLYVLIDNLLNYRVMPIVTSNASRVDISQVYGDAITSRLTALCPETVVVTGKDRRLSSND